jgi:tripartite-type tricarboxylate transporter receptor subunit TctC
VLALVAAPAAISPARELPRPTIQFVNPYATGSPVDLVARPLASKAGDLLGKQVIVRNKPDAGTIIGATFVARDEPDGTGSNLPRSLSRHRPHPSWGSMLLKPARGDRHGTTLLYLRVV